MVLLPKQWDRLAKLSARLGRAIGVSQSGGSTIHVNLGTVRFNIDAQGQPINPPPEMEHLLAEEEHHVHNL